MTNKETGESKAYLIPYGSQVKIPQDSVTTIDGWAFASCNTLTNFELPAHVAEIGDYAFYGYTSLEEVAFADIERNPVNNIYIGSNEFAGCEQGGIISPE